MTIPDRYSYSIRSKQLRNTDRPGDIDVIIAAGFIRDGLPTAIYRLRIEFDAVRGDLILNDRMLVQAIAIANVVQQSVEVGPTFADAIRMQAHDFATSNLCFLLTQLKSFKGCLHKLSRFIRRKSEKAGLNFNRAESEELAGQILDYLLDPLCQQCAGTGYKKTTRGALCPTCKGQGKRHFQFGNGTSYKRISLIKDVFSDIEHNMERINRLMGRFLRG